MNWFQNFVSLWSETVLCGFSFSSECCELVSKFCIFVIWNSYWTVRLFAIKLWIGFKILYLCDLKQFKNMQFNFVGVVNWFQNFVSLWSETVISKKVKSRRCCELVSKFCIFVIWNSKKQKKWNTQQLWIGFKILYLCDLKQFYL